MVRRKAPAGTPALRALQEAGVEHVVREYTHDPSSGLSYGLEAAQALGVDPARVFKTLVAEVDGGLVVAVVPVTGELDLKALAAAVGGKRAQLAERAAAERATGYVVGGISPLGPRRRLPVVVDESALEHATVLVSAGRRGADVELGPRDLLALTGATTARVGRR
ncbi:Cys-tRNA(Pro) deacylase [uncultured Georgenia sp.]|uniref:Cys-tRNA(Pro) deacylase n=1 Tax=uncultured Georgenia sp. TaxID=378209 RepID=UPI00262B315B|nr:Cys-tRNA(Pro) deacylase [uncultured Georgenia sp.]